MFDTTRVRTAGDSRVLAMRRRSDPCLLLARGAAGWRAPVARTGRGPGPAGPRRFDHLERLPPVAVDGGRRPGGAADEPARDRSPAGAAFQPHGSSFAPHRPLRRRAFARDRRRLGLDRGRRGAPPSRPAPTHGLHPPRQPPPRVVRAAAGLALSALRRPAHRRVRLPVRPRGAHLRGGVRAACRAHARWRATGPLHPRDRQDARRRRSSTRARSTSPASVWATSWRPSRCSHATSRPSVCG